MVRSLKALYGTVHWIPSELMIADPLTKKKGQATLLRCVMKHGEFGISKDALKVVMEWLKDENGERKALVKMDKDEELRKQRQKKAALNQRKRNKVAAKKKVFDSHNLCSISCSLCTNCDQTLHEVECQNTLKISEPQPFANFVPVMA